MKNFVELRILPFIFALIALHYKNSLAHFNRIGSAMKTRHSSYAICLFPVAAPVRARRDSLPCGLQPQQ
jgi:hypothetical protein